MRKLRLVALAPAEGSIEEEGRTLQTQTFEMHREELPKRILVIRDPEGDTSLQLLQQLKERAFGVLGEGTLFLAVQDDSTQIELYDVTDDI